jgi:predicted Zn-dependent protease
MRSLDHSDLMSLEAARGWYLLGSLKEADLELNRLPDIAQTHPDVLEVRFAIHSKARKWSTCMELAAALLDLAPERPTAWINSAFTLHEMRQTEDAWNALFFVSDKFPDVPTIPYNLACYACCLGRLDDGRAWLKRAFSLGGSDLKRRALEEQDLKPLWQQIQTLPCPGE